MSRARELLLLVAILGVGALCRFQGLDWDQGQHLHPDERFLTMVETSLRLPDSLAGYLDTSSSPLNPANRGHGYFVYGTFPLFLVRVLGELLGRTTYGEIHLLGRMLAALFDLGTVVVTWRIGVLLAGPASGLAAAALAATSVLSIQNAHFFTVDAFGAFFVALGLLAALRVVTTGGFGWHLVFGLSLGLATACRINLLLVGGAYGLGMLAAWWRRPRRFLPLLAGGLVAAGLAGVVFRIAQPYAFTGPGFFDVGLAPAFRSSLETIRSFVTGGADYPPSVQWIGRTPVLFAGKNLFLWTLGPAWGVAAVFGLVAAIVRPVPADGDVPGRGAAWRVACLWAAGLFLYHSAQFAATGRYFLPLVPVLAVAAVGLLVRSGRAGRMLLALVLVATALWALAFTEIYRRPHTRVEASHWIYAHVPPGDTIASEHWDDALPLALGSRHPAIYERVELPLYDEPGVEKRRQVFEALDAADWIVLSSNRLYRSVPRTPWRYPLGRRYYELLFAGDLGFELVRVFTSYPRLGPLEIPDDAAEEAFTVYDHPKVLVFRKTGAFSRSEVEAQLGAVRLDGIVRVPPREASALYRKMRPPDVPLPGEEAVRTPVEAAPGGSVAALARWLACLEGLAIAMFVLCHPFFRSADVAWGVAKLFAWLVPGYVAWLLAATGMAPHVRPTALGIGVTVGVAAAAFAALRRRELVEALRSSSRRIVTVELVFLGAFAAFAVLRAWNPAIWWGEKPMDFAILNAIVRSHTMPPADPWFAGETLNYGYFGHALVGFLVELTGAAPRHAFNLAIATTGALLVTASFLAGRMLGRSVAAGVAAAVAVGFLGNLEGPFLLLADPGRAIDFHWFWATSRVIEGTINEFPFWNLLFGDLHAHVLAQPLEAFLLVLGLVWALGEARSRVAVVTAGAVVLGAIAVTSPWSLPTGTALALGFAACAWRDRGGGIGRGVAVLAGWVAVVAVALVAFVPFWLDYERAAGRSWGWETQAAPVAAVVRIFGVFLAVVVPALAGTLARHFPRGRWLAALAAAAAVTVGVMRSPAAGTYAALAFLGLLVWWLEDEDERELRIAAMLVALAGAIGVGTETVYVWDRMNTVFKYYLGMWLVLAPAAAMLALRLLRGRFVVARAAVLAVLAGAGLVTSAVGASGFLRHPMVTSDVPTVDGMSYLEAKSPDELAAWEWLNQNVRGLPVVLEAQGASYQEFSRVAMNTGLPTVLGWEYHLFQQAHSWDDIHERRHDVETAFSTPKREIAAPLLDKYGVDLVVVGPLERRTYPTVGLAKFRDWPRYPEVFRNASVTVYGSPGILGATKTWIEPVVSSDGPPAGLLREARDVARRSDGSLVVADFGHDRIQTFQPDGEPMASWGREGVGPAEFRDPSGIAVAPDGTVYVADAWNHRVQVLSPAGDAVAEWHAGFYGPRGIALAPDGTVLVTDTGHHRIVRLGSDGTSLGEIGKGELASPVGIDVAPDGEIYVADVDHRRIVVFSPAGDLVRVWPVDGWTEGSLREPHLEIGPDETVWVTDPSGNRVLLFDREGRSLGTATPERPLSVPLGLAVVSENRAVVTSGTSPRLHFIRK